MTNKCSEAENQCEYCPFAGFDQKGLQAGEVIDNFVARYPLASLRQESIEEFGKAAEDGAQTFKTPELTGAFAGALVLIATRRCMRYPK